jgi:hypothetical protein
MFDNRWCQYGQLGELTVDKNYLLVEVIFPSEHNGLCISAAGKIGGSYWFVHTLYDNLLPADAKVRPSIESELAELLYPTLFRHLVVVRGRPWTEP